MKKLILSAAIVLGSLSIHASALSPENTVVKSIIQDEYKEVIYNIGKIILFYI